MSGPQASTSGTRALDERRRPLRRRDALHQHAQHYGPNMTPMVDVVVVILIFYMSVASFAGSEWFLRTALPKAQGTAPKDMPRSGDPFDLGAARFEVTLTRDGNRTVARGQGFDGLALDALAERLREIAKGTGEKDLILVIRSEPDVPYGDVIRAHDAAAAAGIAKVGLMDTRN